MAIKFEATGKQAFIDTPVYTVKAVKSFQGREGYGYECSLYRDGKKVGRVVDTANGGMVDFYLNDGEEEILDAYCKTLPKWKSQFDGKMNDTDADMFIGRLVDEYENEKRFKRICRTKTVVKMTTDEDGSYSTFKCKFTPEIKQKIIERYGDKIVEFVNERFA